MYCPINKAAVLAAIFIVPSFAFAQFLNDLFPWDKPVPALDIPMTPRPSPAEDDPVLIAKHTELWNYSSWVHTDSTTFTYNEEKALILEKSQKPEGPYWNNNQRITYQYDDGKLSQTLRQYWNGSEWINFLLNAFEYDEDDFMTVGLEKTWDITTSEWFITSRFLYEYGNPVKVASITRQNYSGGIWRNNLLFTYEYDDAGNITQMLIQDWDGLIWEDYQKNAYVYDENGNRLSGLVHQFKQSDWQLVGQFLYEYDEDGNYAGMLTQRLNGGTEMENWFYDHYFWEETPLSSNVVFNLPEVSLNAFPNPSNGSLTLELPAEDLSNGFVQFINAAGQRVFIQGIPAKARLLTLDLSFLQEGVYFLQVLSDGVMVASEKVVRQ